MKNTDRFEKIKQLLIEDNSQIGKVISELIAITVNQEIRLMEIEEYKKEMIGNGFWPKP